MRKTRIISFVLSMIMILATFGNFANAESNSADKKKQANEKPMNTIRINGRNVFYGKSLNREQVIKYVKESDEKILNSQSNGITALSSRNTHISDPDEWPGENWEDIDEYTGRKLKYPIYTNWNAVPFTQKTYLAVFDNTLGGSIIPEEGSFHKIIALPINSETAPYQAMLEVLLPDLDELLIQPDPRLEVDLTLDFLGDQDLGGYVFTFTGRANTGHEINWYDNNSSNRPNLKGKYKVPTKTQPFLFDIPKANQNLVLRKSTVKRKWLDKEVVYPNPSIIDDDTVLIAAEHETYADFKSYLEKDKTSGVVEGLNGVNYLYAITGVDDPQINMGKDDEENWLFPRNGSASGFKYDFRQELKVKFNSGRGEVNKQKKQQVGDIQKIGFNEGTKVAEENERGFLDPATGNVSGRSITEPGIEGVTPPAGEKFIGWSTVQDDLSTKINLETSMIGPDENQKPFVFTEDETIFYALFENDPDAFTEVTVKAENGTVKNYEDADEPANNVSNPIEVVKNSKWKDVEPKAKKLVHPNDGYKFVRWTIKDAVDPTASIDGELSITEPITVVANFKKIATTEDKSDDDDYVAVKFSKGKNGTLTVGQEKNLPEKVYYVLKVATWGEAKANIVEPTIVPEEGYVVADPKWNNNYANLPNGDLVIAQEFVAQYQEKGEKVTITYAANPTEGGSVAPTSESLAPVTGVAQGSTAKATEVYKFINWTKDGKPVSTAAKFVPTKNKDAVWTETTYTANFKKIVVTIDPKDEAYAKVTFLEGDNGTLTGTTEYWVLKVATWEEAKKGITLPKINANPGYEAATPNWDPNYDELKGEVAEDKTFTAKYQEKSDKVTITYAANPTEGGSVAPTSEELKPVTGEATGSTATAKPGYEFVNWTNEAGEEVSTEAKFTPAKVEGLNVAATYTANFREKTAVIPTDPKNPQTPEGYVLVLFQEGDHGYLKGIDKDGNRVPRASELAYNVEENATYKNLEPFVPSIVPNAGWMASYQPWSPALGAMTAKVVANTHVAQYIERVEPDYPDVIPNPTEPTPVGYVRVSFDPTRDGILSTKTQYGEMQVYDVKATLTWAEAVAKGMEVPKATHAYYDFIFDGWAPRLQDDRELVKAETYVAQYYDMSNYYHREEKVEKRYDLHREMHYVQGTGKGLFSPNKGMTRAEAATILANVLRNEGFIKTLRVLPYSDVDRNAWYYDSALIVTQANVFKGTDKGMFEGERLITRAEWIATLARFQRIRAIYGNNLGIKDGHWAINEVEGAFQQGWLALYRRGTDFDMAIPRQEAVYIANRAFGKVIDRDFVNKNLDKMISFPDVNKANEFFYDIIAASNTYFTSKDRGEWLNSLTRKGDFILKMGNYQITQTLYRR